MHVIEARYVNPINAMAGLYVSIEGTREEIYGSQADELAIRTANKKGWNGNGKATVGIPVQKGVRTYTKAYWFYERLK
ncbi:hypothetical protein [Effusibacillus consociatus]|uniref:Uncharacterized protein n=1 Tax=Effusibacillus consociatus TaxID=1117041 RepID=A0ABV9Q075_9BACL